MFATLRALVGVISEVAVGVCWGVEQEEGVRVSVELRSSWELADPIPAVRRLGDSYMYIATFYTCCLLRFTVSLPSPPPSLPFSSPPLPSPSLSPEEVMEYIEARE